MTAPVIEREERKCQHCGHDFDPHVLVAPEDPMKGGIMICPVMNCECFSTWGVGKGSKPSKDLPDRAEIAAIRERIQTKAAREGL